MPDTGRKMAKGAAWMVLFKLTERSLGLVSTIILARLLVPQDFGLVAMAMSVIVILELIGAFNFDVSIIQNQNADRSHYDTAWTLNILFSLTLASVLLLLATPVADFYDEPRLVGVIYWLTLGMALHGFENIGVVMFRKKMEFHKDFQFLFWKKIASFSVTVPLAFILQNYWALIIGMLTGKFAGLALSYVVSSYRPKFSLVARRELFRFSKWLLFNNMLFFLRTRSADFVIGKLNGTHALGLYSIAYEISNLPSTELVMPINRAVFPGYAHLSKDLSALRQGFLDVLSTIALLTLPAAVGIAVTADLIVNIFLGEKWVETIPLIQILAFYGALMATQSTPIFLALGKPHMTTYMTLGLICVFIPSMIVLTQRYGAIGAAWACLGSALLIMPVNYFFIFRDLQLSVKKFAAVVGRPVTATVTMAGAVWFYRMESIEAVTLAGQVMHLSLSILLGAVVYIAMILLLWNLNSRPRGSELFILIQLQQRIPWLRRIRVADNHDLHD